MLKIKIKDKPKKQIIDSVAGLANKSSRKRAVVAMLGLNSFASYMAGAGHNVRCDNSCCQNYKLLNDFDIADLTTDDVKFDVRTLVTADYSQMWVPKAHFEFGFVPEFYVAVRINKKLNSAEIIGFIESAAINKSLSNEQYYIVPVAALKPVEELDNALKTIIPRKTIHLRIDHNKAKELFLSYIDGSISVEHLNFLINHIASCKDCRTEFNEFYKFNRLFAHQLIVSQEITEIFKPQVEVEPVIDASIAGLVAVPEVEVEVPAPAVKLSLWGKIKNFIKKPQEDIEEEEEYEDEVTEEFEDIDSDEVVSEDVEYIEQDLEQDSEEDKTETFTEAENAEILEETVEASLENEVLVEVDEEELAVEEPVLQDALLADSEVVNLVNEDAVEEASANTFDVEMDTESAIISVEDQDELLFETLQADNLENDSLEDGIKLEEVLDNTVEDIQQMLDEVEVISAVEEETVLEFETEPEIQPIVEEVKEEPVQQDEFFFDMSEDLPEIQTAEPEALVETEAEEMFFELSDDQKEDTLELQESLDLKGEEEVFEIQPIETLQTEEIPAAEIIEETSIKEEPAVEAPIQESISSLAPAVQDKLDEIIAAAAGQGPAPVLNPADVPVIEPKAGESFNIEAMLADLDNVEIISSVQEFKKQKTEAEHEQETVKEEKPVKTKAKAKKKPAAKANKPSNAKLVKMAAGVAVVGILGWSAYAVISQNNPSGVSNMAAVQSPVVPVSQPSQPVPQAPAPTAEQPTQPTDVQPASVSPVEASSGAVKPKYKNINDVLANAFVSQGNEIKITNISWEISSSLASNDVFKNYLMVTGQALKMALGKNLLTAKDSAVNNQVKVAVILDLQGNIKDMRVKTGTGSDEVDGIILQTIKDTFSYTKLPAIQTKKQYIKTSVIINL